MRIDKHTSLSEYILYLNILGGESDVLDETFERLKSFPIPAKLKVSFNDLLFCQLIDLQTKVKTFTDLIFVPLETIHKLKKEDILKYSAFDCLRFALYTKDELERITKLFQDIEYKPSAEEIKAGIGNINHGFFGTVDWYARRMGITDHDQVTSLPWVRIYQCLKIDFENGQFERNYRKVIEQKSKVK